MGIHDSHRDRMRERIAQDGIESLQEHEILEYLLYSFIPRKDTNAIAHCLIDQFGSLAGVLESSPELLQNTVGMTQKGAGFLCALPGIFKKYGLSKYGKRPVLDCYANIKAYLDALLSNDNEEHLFLLSVDTGGRLQQTCELGAGTESGCTIATRKLITACATMRAPNIYLVHNHPSGNAQPSLADLEFTKWAVSAMEMLGLLLVDHIIVARGNFYSFQCDGRLEEYRKIYRDFMEKTRISDRN